MPEQTLEYLLRNTIFDEMKRTVPNYRERIHVILGDIQYSDLGLHQDDRKTLIDKIHIVIHCGATLNFMEPLKTAVRTNVRGTRDILKLAEEMKNLKCAMYVSTAYSNCNHLSVGEYFYKPPVLPDTLIKMVDEMVDEVLKNITPEMIADWPNTYTEYGETLSLYTNLVQSIFSIFLKNVPYMICILVNTFYIFLLV